MKFISFKTAQYPDGSLGVELEGKIFNVSQAAHLQPSVPATMLELIQSGDAGIDKIRELLAAEPGNDFFLALEKIEYLPAIKTGKNVFCVGRNYREHIIEGNRASGRPENQFPEAIEFFTKPPTALVGSRQCSSPCGYYQQPRL